VKNKRKIRAYQKSDGDVFIMLPEHIRDVTIGHHYPYLQCPYKKEKCSSNCAFFNSSWQGDSKVFCGDTQIGVLE